MVCKISMEVQRFGVADNSLCDLIHMIPIWDGNPEVFELDPDKLGLPNMNIPARSTFSAVGVIGYDFGHYEFWPTELTVNLAPLPVAVRAKATDEGTVGSFNLFRLFDDVADGTGDAVLSSEDYARRTAKIASYIVDLMGSPDILAIQEVEKLGVLQNLAAVINTLDGSVNKAAAYLGPSFQGISERAGDRVPELSAVEYLRQSIVDPSAYVVEGFIDRAMPKNYRLLISEEDIDNLIAFLLTQ